MGDLPTVLIADEDTDLLQLLAFNFESEGFDTIKCEDGAEALAHLEETDTLPDAIIFELLMPDVDGKELLRQRRDSERLSAIPAVVLTGVDDEEMLEKAYELGADDYVTKPFSPNALITRVRHLIG